MSTDPRGPASDAPAPPRELWQIVCAKHGMECASTGPFRSTLEARDNLPYCGFIGHGGLRIEPLAASPAQEATPPRVAEYERQLRDAAEEHEDVNASFALEAFLALKRAAPTPEASGAAEPEPACTCGTGAHDRQHAPDCPASDRNIIASLRATVAALTAERTQDTERLDWLNGRVSWFTQHHAFNPDYANVREAIDAARRAAPRGDAAP